MCFTIYFCIFFAFSVGIVLCRTLHQINIIFVDKIVIVYGCVAQL